MNEDKRTYIVKPGRRFGKSNEFGPGSEVELTAAEFAGFKDKLIRKGSADPNEAAEAAEAKGAAADDNVDPVEAAAANLAAAEADLLVAEANGDEDAIAAAKKIVTSRKGALTRAKNKAGE